MSKKIINKYLKEQFGAEINMEFEIMDNGRVWVGNNLVFGFDINSVVRKGLYFGFVEKDGLRLSIEGTQLVGPKAKKNIIELNDVEAEEWLRGYALEKKAQKGYVLLRYKNHFLGCGKSNGERIWNNVPKERRIRM